MTEYHFRSYNLPAQDTHVSPLVLTMGRKIQSIAMYKLSRNEVSIHIELLCWQVQFIGYALGSNQNYEGKSMVDTHKHLEGLRMSHFDSVRQHLKEALEELDVDQVCLDHASSPEFPVAFRWPSMSPAALIICIVSNLMHRQLYESKICSFQLHPYETMYIKMLQPTWKEWMCRIL